LPFQDEGLKDSPPWRQDATQTRRLASHFKKTLDDTFPKDGQDDPEDEDEGDAEQPGVNLIKLFFSSSLALRPNKLERLSLASLSTLV
jgi:hypothetical protein